MNKIYDFSYKHGITATVNKTTLTLHGANAVLKLIAKDLTVENKSISYNIKMVKDKIKRLKSSNYCNPNKLELAEQELEDLEAQRFIEYFDWLTPTELEVPKGFWYLAKEPCLIKNMKYFDFPEGEIKINPRPYQIEAVQSLIKHERAMIELATGLGKTVVLTHLIHNILKNSRKKNTRVMVVVPTIELMKQTLSFISKFIPNAHGIGGTKKYKTDCTVLVGVINSCIQYADRFDAVIIDEVHHGASNMYNNLIFGLKKDALVYGMTATPCRADGLVLGVHANCGPVLYRKNTAWGVKQGYLCESDFWCIKMKTRKRLYDNMHEAKAYSTLILQNDVLKMVARIVKSMLSKGRRILFLTKHAKPSQEFANRLSELLNLKIESASSKYRKPLNDFKKGETQILIANDALCGEGVDIPTVDCMINLTQRSSESSIRQILGRGLRVSEDKDKLIFFDFCICGYGNWARKMDGTSYFKDRYEGSFEVRKRIYQEIGTINLKEY